MLIVTVGASAHYRVGSPNSTAVVDRVADPAEADDHVEHHHRAVRRRGDVHDPRRSGAGEGHVGQLPGRRYRAARPGLRAAARDHRAARRPTRSVTVTLRSIRKDVVFEPTDMIVGHWPIRIGQVFVKEGDPLPPGTPILSLTDPTFTVTLQASASDRTKLDGRSERARSSSTGGDKEVDGTISELDQNLTSLTASTPGGTRGPGLRRQDQRLRSRRGRRRVGEHRRDGATEDERHHGADRGGEAERLRPGRRARHRPQEPLARHRRRRSRPDSPKARTSRSRRA